MYAVVDVKRQSIASMAGHTAHEMRTAGDLSHIEKDRSDINQRIAYGDDPDSPKKAVEQYIKDKKIRIDKRNDTPITSLILSASPEYFEMKDGIADKEKLGKWVKASMGWAGNEFGEDLVHASLHLDEKTPHLHIKIVPTYEKKLKSGTVLQASHHKHKAFAGRKSYERVWDRYAEAVEHLGIERGERLPEGAQGNAKTARQWVNDIARSLANSSKTVAILDEREKALVRGEGNLAQERQNLDGYRDCLLEAAQQLERDERKAGRTPTDHTRDVAQGRSHGKRLEAPEPRIEKRIEKRARRKPKTVPDER